MSLTPTADETLGIIVGIVSCLLDQTCRITFPTVFRSGICTKMINRMKLTCGQKEELSKMGKMQKTQANVTSKHSDANYVTFYAIAGPQSPFI